ncbi:oxidoreductase [Consotaella salsifontis]|uniref:Predicted dehydrogenase n=1 Tax=Consotaella salsifontis TaxID=1365950 RepID=A0A1T4S5I6_9HYPH|nr:oxidoreductase [Consotaella salsifontis]SKA23417.1 Predicted dehydrogenase [Consotaella salsifontis]
MKTLSSNRPARVGLIGFGYVGKTFHMPLLMGSEGYEIRVVASGRPEAVKVSLPEVRVVAEAGEAVTHPDVDLVVIATPNETHAPLAEAALAAGKHVVVDKPFTVTLAEARHLVELATASDGLLSVFQNRRWDSDFLTVKAAMESGSLGHVALYESRIERYRPAVRDRWREDGRPGSGLLYDLGPHLIDQALTLFGLPDDLEATVLAQRPGARSDDFFRLTLRYGARLAVLQASVLVAGGGRRFAIHGDRASLVKAEPDIQEDQLKSGMMPGTKGWGEDSDDAWLHVGETGEARRVKTTPGDQRGYYAALLKALRGEASNPVPPEQASAVMALIEAALRSQDEGRRIVPELTVAERAAWK